MTDETKLSDPVSDTKSASEVVKDGHENGAVEKEKSTDETKDLNVTDDHEYPSAWSLTAIMIALYLAIFLVALVSRT
jgi:hypothetical protein